MVTSPKYIVLVEYINAEWEINIRILKMNSSLLLNKILDNVPIFLTFMFSLGFICCIREAIQGYKNKYTCVVYDSTVDPIIGAIFCLIGAIVSFHSI